MRLRRARMIDIFSMSALDLFAMAMGVFLIFGVVMAPFFLQREKGSARLEGFSARQAELRKELEARRASTEQLVKEAQALERQAETVKQQIDIIKRKNRKKPRPAPPTPAPAPAPAGGATRAILKELDLVFVIDSTASMEQELNHLAASIDSISEVLSRLVLSFRIGIITYRDYDNSPWVTRGISLHHVGSGGSRELHDFAESLRPARRGGATATEAVKAGLEKALGWSFRPQARVRVLVIGDAAAHKHERNDALALARDFHRSGPDRRLSSLFIHTLAFAQYGAGDDRFFAELAQAGGGAFHRRTTSLMAYVVEEALARPGNGGGK